MSKKIVPPNQLVINVALVGKYGCGKTAILVKFYTNRYIFEYSSLINDLVQKDEIIDGRLCCLNIQDYSDSDTTYYQNTFKWADIIMVVYSITSRSSYYRAMEIVKMYSQRKNENQERKSIAILVANKSDLADFRLVQTSESVKTAQELGIPHIECNVVYDIEIIKNLFHESVRLYIQQKRIKKSSFRFSETIPAISKFILSNQSNNSVKLPNNKSINDKSVVLESTQKKNSVAFRLFSKKSK